MKNIIILIAALSVAACSSSSQLRSAGAGDVWITGAMRDAMWKGEIFGKINLDTISDKTNLYGLGPVEYLSGELLITDGRCYRSTVVSATEMKVEEIWDVKAPFFVRATVPAWKETALPDSIVSLPLLESYLNQITQKERRPFAFQIKGPIETALIHIVNLPPGTQVSSPDEAHQGIQHYSISNTEALIVGFFSTEHQAVFTHHDTFMHLHLMTEDKKQMGHLEEASFQAGRMRLLLPGK
jgi:acetolactate decarboxylase